MTTGSEAVNQAVWWSADFWQRVVISGSGTLGAFLIAVALFYWKRHYDKKDADAQRQDDLRWRLAETVHAYRDKLLGDSDALKTVTGYRDGLSFLYAMDEYGDRIDDPVIKKYCHDHKDQLLSYWSGGPRREHSIAERWAYVEFIGSISATLPAYLTINEPLMTDSIRPEADSRP